MRTAVLIVVAIGMAVAGWFGGRWMRAQAGHSETAGVSLTKPPAPKPLTREPRVDPNSPPGQWIVRVRAATAADFTNLFDEIEKLWPEKRGNHDIRNSAIEFLLARWIIVDLERAVEFITAKNQRHLVAVFGGLLGHLAPDRAIEWIERAPAEHREYCRSDALEALAAAHPAKFLELNRTGDDDWPRQMRGAVGTLAERDPQAAAAYVMALPADGNRTHVRALYGLMEGWHRRDPQAARQWASELKDSELRRSAHHALFGEFAKADPRAALNALSDWPELGDYLGGEGRLAPYEQFNALDARREIVSALATESIPEAFAAVHRIMASLGKSDADGAGQPGLGLFDKPTRGIDPGDFLASRTAPPQRPSAVRRRGERHDRILARCRLFERIVTARK